MRSIDTNILVRWLMRDDAEQAAIADEIMAGNIEIPHTVLLEFEWVMRSVGKAAREDISGMMQYLLAVDTVYIEKRDLVRWAVERYVAGADWADMIHLVAINSGDNFLTFDRSLGKDAGPGTPVRVECVSR